jgi:DNA-directed RNA polymerase subunit RPC12/RpoP
MKTIGCHDCGNPVALSARQCPHCGSKELAGPYEPKPKRPRVIGIEQRNDRNLAATSLALGLLGACYGYATSSSMLGAILATLSYGLVGVTVGVPIGFAINFLRT